MAGTWFFETLPVGVVFQDADGRITAANAAAQRILGLWLEQLQGRTSIDRLWRATREDGSLYPGENHPAMVALRTGRPVRGALMGVYNAVSDEQRWIRIDATPFVPRRDDGRREVYTTFQDVTGLRAAERALRESEALFRLTFDQAPLGTALTDPLFRFTEVNDALCTMLGYTREELLQLGFPDVTHPDEVDIDVLETGRLGAGEIDEHGREKRYVRKDGSVVWGRVVVRPVVDAAGARIAQLAMVDDITERRRAAAALRESETRYRIVADNTYDWEWWLDPAGKFAYFSPGFTEITGYDVEEFGSSRERLLEIVHPDDREKMRRHLTGELTEGRGDSAAEFRIRTRDGRERWFDHRCKPVYDEVGTWLGRRASNRDVTEQRRAEEELRRVSEELQRRIADSTEELRAVSRRLAALTTSAAHEARVPLRPADDTDAAPGDEGGALQDVHAALRTLARLLDDLTDSSRVASREPARRETHGSA